MSDIENYRAKLSNPGLDYNSLNLRLNPEPLLEKIEIFLKGEKESYTRDKAGNVIKLVDQFGLRKANNNGIQSIYSWISGIINTQIVQGNFPISKLGHSEKYEDFIYYFRMDFSEYLMKNLYEFDIDETEFEGIIDFVMSIIVPYMSRLIGNEERLGYNQTLKSEERNVITEVPGKRGFGSFG